MRTWTDGFRFRLTWWADAVAQLVAFGLDPLDWEVVL